MTTYPHFKRYALLLAVVLLGFGFVAVAQQTVDDPWVLTDEDETCPEMSEEDNKQLVLRFSEEAVKGNGDVVAEILHEDFIGHGVGDVETVRGRIQGGVPYPFEDMKVTIEEVIAEDDMVVLRSKVEATHHVTFAGVEPTGQPLTWTGIGIFRVECGKVIEAWTESDNLVLLQQVGAVPSIMEPQKLENLDSGGGETGGGNTGGETGGGETGGSETGGSETGGG